MVNIKGLPASMYSKLLKQAHRLDHKSRHVGSSEFGSIGDLARALPDQIKPCVFIFCSDHGIAADNISILPQDFAARSYKDFSHGLGIPFSLGECFNIEVKAFDCSLGNPTKHISYCNAMTPREYLKCLCIGWNAVRHSCCNLIGIGEVGAGGTSTATALASILLDIEPEYLLGHGSGISESQLRLKANLINLALDRVHYTADLSTLMIQIGGKEIVSMVGAILASYAHGKTVVLDGFITCVSALIAEKLFPGISSCLLCCTRTNEPGQQKIAEVLKLNPFIHLGHSCGMGFGCFFSVQACKASFCLNK